MTVKTSHNHFSWIFARFLYDNDLPLYRHPILLSILGGDGVQNCSKWPEMKTVTPFSVRDYLLYMSNLILWAGSSPSSGSPSGAAISDSFHLLSGVTVKDAGSSSEAFHTTTPILRPETKARDITCGASVSRVKPASFTKCCPSMRVNPCFPAGASIRDEQSVTPP